LLFRQVLLVDCEPRYLVQETLEMRISGKLIVSIVGFILISLNLHVMQL
jgi:hypothetical protein